ncbi:Trihelix transcription factor GT-2 [Morus notabilis]|uniref:Trihelix transcription factor GT-2 n=1 Tax=Morus notabilis TaxID=981085 RepID=W9S063_9ROSA|nr:trihelix transcription factor GT-2 [Morus notabilis]EXC19898.1 Trihelix transcription factor GT-2 [Morus notabilis]
MLGDSSSTALGSSSGDASAAAAEAPPTETAHDGGGSGGGGEDERIRGEELGDRSFGGNRWPRQETISLLKIRSDMDVAFRDASVKGPLWEEVSRKLAELGYHRSAKKCKEKFENVYKYHKRTKEGRSGKADGKTYRFFDQLQALENQPSPYSLPPPPPPPQPAAAAATTTQPKAQAPAMQAATTTTIATATPAMSVSISPLHNSTVPSVSNTTATNISSQGTMNLTFPSPPFQAAPTNPTINFPTPPPVQGTAPTPTPPPPFHRISADLMSEYSTSSSTSSDEELEEGGGRRKRKRKWKDFFERLMKEVIHRQEELQKRFLEAIEKREHDRMVREEAWRMQEMTRINREREILAQERSMAAAKDAAVMAFLQKISDQQNIPNISIPNPTPTPTPAPPPPPPSSGQNNTTSITPVISIQTLQPSAPAPAVLIPAPTPVAPVSVSAPMSQLATIDVPKPDNNNNNNNALATTTPMTAGMGGASSSRWPKVEVHALIKLRTDLDAKYQDNGPKGPLWEEISEAMKRVGYNRSAKRCKEKWENINKYFKKVKESNKRRPEDSKTCPYFHQLDALYREKSMKFDPTISSTTTTNDNIMSTATAHHHHQHQLHQFGKSEINVVPLMVQPEQQWPPPPQQPGSSNQHESAESDQPMDRNEEEDEEDDDEDEDEDDEGGDNYELVANKPNSVSNVSAE